MPSYALNQFIDLDDVLCKHLLNLDLREPAKISPHAAVGYRKPDSPCTLSSSGSGLSLDSMESGSINASYWGSQKVSSQSKWSKTPFWSERSISMIEGNTGSLGWSSAEPGHLRQPLGAASLSSSTSSISATSSRYKTELCRTFAERGVCKYGAKCQFAHGPEEVRDLNRHPKYKTDPCRTFHSIGFCPYGIRCHFVHNAEDDQMDGRPHATNAPVQRPPLLKQSFSFSGFPTAPQPLDAPLATNSFLRAPSVSSPTPTTITDLLSLAFPDIDPSTLLEQARDINPQFLPSPDSGCSNTGLSPTQLIPPQTDACSRLSPTDLLSLAFPDIDPSTLLEHARDINPQFLPSPDSGCSNSGLSPTQLIPPQTDACSRRSPTGGASLGLRSLSHTSLSDHEGGSCSSSSSMSGSESSFGHDGSGRRLPIFSQLSVPDDVIYSESGNSSASFFL